MFDKSEIDKINEQLKIWKEKNIKSDSKTLSSRSGIPVDFVYTPVDIEKIDYLQDLNLPGEHPFTR